MSYKQIFNGREVQEPGVYSQIKSGIKNPPQNLAYGNILIIDTGSGAGFGGGAGISGELAEMKGAIYSFDNIEDFRSHVKGGLHWSLALPLFRPNGFQNPGVSKYSLQVQELLHVHQFHILLKVAVQMVELLL
jgi:hypothetical protein